MSDIRIDNNPTSSAFNDIEIIEGDLSLTETLDAIRQHVSQRLRTFLAEWFLDQRVGVPYFQQIHVKNPNPAVVESVLKREVLTTPGVLELLEWDLDLDVSDRTLNLEFKARTTDGIVDFTEILGV